MDRGMAKENSRKERRMVKEIMHLRLLMGKQSLFVIFLEILVMLKTPAEINVNPSGKAGAQIPQLPLGDNSSPWGDNAICT
jgi:hypothetical protein